MAPGCLPADHRGEALVPCLFGLLENCGYMAETCLLSVCRRTQKIAQVTETLKSFGISNTRDFSMKLSCMNIEQRRKFRWRLCHFDQKTFNEIGRALYSFMSHRNVRDEYVGKYLQG